MIAEHASQTDWLLKQHGITDPVEAMAGLSQRRGQESGVDYAEGFRQYRHEPYPRTPKLQELLGLSSLQCLASKSAEPVAEEAEGP